MIGPYCVAHKHGAPLTILDLADQSKQFQVAGNFSSFKGNDRPSAGINRYLQKIVEIGKINEKEYIGFNFSKCKRMNARKDN